MGLTKDINLVFRKDVFAANHESLSAELKGVLEKVTAWMPESISTTNWLDD
jgi:hypothetical protein